MEALAEEENSRFSVSLRDKRTADLSLILIRLRALVLAVQDQREQGNNERCG